MAALVNSKGNSFRIVKRAKRQLAGGVKAIKGGMAVCIDGYYQPATGALGEAFLGRFTETVDNLLGADGARFVEVEFTYERTLMLLLNDATNPVLITDREKMVSIQDDQTVRSYTATRSDGGVFFDFDPNTGGVFVEPPVFIRPPA